MCDKEASVAMVQRLFLSSEHGAKYAADHLRLQNERDEIDRKEADFWAKASADFRRFLKS
jgi:hypothetical protein